MQVVNKTTAKTPEREGEPIKLLKRVGSTTYVVSIRFSDSNAETLEDKILRIIESEVNKSA